MESTTSEGSDGARPDQVEVRVPAEGAYLSVLRGVTAGLAARLDFTLDEIDDLRIAVDEACALLLPAAPAAALRAAFSLEDDALRVSVATRPLEPETPKRDTFAWTVLTALAGEVDATLDDGVLTVVLRKQRDRGQPS